MAEIVGRETLELGLRTVALAYKRPVVYGLKINPYRSNGLKNPYAGAVKHGLWKPENP
jgi:hypothetical protein